MKKGIWILLGSVGVVLFFLGGVYVGSLLSTLEDGFETNTIAIVNLDEGVSYEGENRFFSNEVLDVSNTQYKMTGISDARNGVTNGIYAGYIVMGADFSKNVTSINTTPNTIELTYQIGDQLTEKSKENAIYTIHDFEKDVNSKLSNVFLYSVLQQFHEGQDNAQTVIKNDQNDLGLIRNIQSLDLVHMVELTEVKEVDNPIVALDIEKEIETGTAIMQEMDTSYKEYMGLSADQLARIKEDYQDLRPSLINIDSKLQEFTSIMNQEHQLQFPLSQTKQYIDTKNSKIQQVITNHNEDIATYNQELATYNQGIDLYNMRVVKHHNQQMQDIKDIFIPNNPLQIQLYEMKIQNQILLYLQENPEKTYQDALDEFTVNQELDEDITTFLQALGEDIDPDVSVVEQYQEYITKADNELRYQEYQDTYTSVYTQITDINPVVNVNNVVLTIAPLPMPEMIDTSLVEVAIKMDISGLYTNQNKVIEDTHTNYQIQKEKQDTLGILVTAYDPLSYIDERTLERLVKQYDSNIKVMSTAIYKKEEEYDTLNREVYKTTHVHVEVLREDVITANEASNVKVEEGLQELQGVKEENSGENQLLMKNFIGTLTNTRNGSLTNSEVANFMTQPIHSDGAVGNSQTSLINVQEYAQTGLFVTIGVAIVAIVGVMVMMMIQRKKTREEDK